VFYANDCGTAGYRLSSPSRGHFRLDQAWLVHQSGTTPIISHGVLYVANGKGITAHNPINGAVLTRVTGVNGVHWEYPLAAGHRLFMTDESGHVTAYEVR
jgi:hypothetical protein